MPRYFFHRLDGVRDLDTEGTELTDLNAARREAVLYAAETMREQPDEVWREGEIRVEVSDSTGMLLLVLVMLGVESPAITLSNSAHPPT